MVELSYTLCLKGALPLVLLLFCKPLRGLGLLCLGLVFRSSPDVFAVCEEALPILVGEIGILDREIAACENVSVEAIAPRAEKQLIVLLLLLLILPLLLLGELLIELIEKKIKGAVSP